MTARRLRRGQAAQRRSPLKEKPLRNPGQSLEEKIAEIQTDTLLTPFILAVVAVVFAGMEWWRDLSNSPPQPIGASFIAAILIAYAVRKVLKVREELRRLRLGAQGERTVAHELDLVRREGWRIFHDVPGHGFNVDHVVVAPQGVFAVETKTFSKPSKGDATVSLDGDRLLVGGREPDRSPIVQGRAVRDWIGSVLEETTGRRFPVRGVVAFPGWYVTGAQAKGADAVWVLNPKGFLKFVEREPIVLSLEDVALVASRLAVHVRTWV